MISCGNNTTAPSIYTGIYIRCKWGTEYTIKSRTTFNASVPHKQILQKQPIDFYAKHYAIEKYIYTDISNSGQHFKIDLKNRLLVFVEKYVCISNIVKWSGKTSPGFMFNFVAATKKLGH